MTQDLELIVRLAVSALIGSAIGIERERLRWAAGLRTHMLVCVGSCLVMIVSAYGFSDVLRPNVVLDPSRVAAQVVSGIGFLGAGSIILRNEVVKGLTTAASLWTAASPATQPSATSNIGSPGSKRSTASATLRATATATPSVRSRCTARTSSAGIRSTSRTIVSAPARTASAT